MKSKKYKCSKCETKDYNQYRFMKFLEDGKIYCDVCVSELGQSEMEEWMEQNFRELR